MGSTPPSWPDRQSKSSETATGSPASGVTDHLAQSTVRTRLSTAPGSPFTTRLASIQGGSVANAPVVGELRRVGWTRISRGVYLPVQAVDSLGSRAAAWAMVLPQSAVITHLSAAALRGWWLPRTPPELPFFVATPRDAPPAATSWTTCRTPQGPATGNSTTRSARCLARGNSAGLCT